MTDERIRILVERGKDALNQQTPELPAFLRGKKTVAPSENNTQPAPPLQIKAGLEPYTEPLTAPKARHLLRRVGFGAPVDKLNALIDQNPAEVIDQLVDEALDVIATPPPDAPTWANEPLPPPNASQAEIDAFVENNLAWLEEFQNEWFGLLAVVGLRERMTLFWHNHFVTQVDDYFFAMHAYRYVKVLREYALGNFKNFVHAVGTDPAMLEYLDGNTNRVGEPNENYGRELLELFTMGPLDKEGGENYTQQDIEETARALTGWVIDYFGHRGQFVESRFDAGEKTIFGKTGAYGYDEVIDLIFEERAEQIAFFVCDKLYRAFVYAVPDPVIVQGLADELIAQDFEIAPVLRLLLKSAHFFDSQLLGAGIASPLALLAGMPPMVKMAGAEDQGMFLRFLAAFLGQDMLNPPNVAGWPGYRTWISTTSLPIRWLITDFIILGDEGQNLADLVSVASQFEAASDPLAAFKLPVALAEYLMAVPIENLDIGQVSEEFGGDLVNFPIPEEILNGPRYQQDLAKIFLAGVPWYEWSLDAELAPVLLALFVRFLTQMPEFHLN